MPDALDPARETEAAPDATAAHDGVDRPPMTAPTPERRASTYADELVSRGLLFALIAIPAGIIVWVLLWQWGFIASIAAFAVAWAALALYRYGSGGTVSRAGFWVVVSVTAVTLVLSFLAGIAWDLAAFLEVEPFAAVVSSEFWWVFRENLGYPDLWASYLPDILISLLLAALGTFSVFRRLASQTSGIPELRFK